MNASRPSVDPQLTIEIVYAEPHRGRVRPMRVARGSCVEDALREAALDPVFQDLDLPNRAIGIFGKAARRDQLLEEGDRIEIYRPLIQDPKEARRARALDAAKKLRQESARRPPAGPNKSGRS